MLPNSAGAVGATKGIDDTQYSSDSVVPASLRVPIPLQRSILNGCAFRMHPRDTESEAAGGCGCAVTDAIPGNMPWLLLLLLRRVIQIRKYELVIHIHYAD